MTEHQTSALSQLRTIAAALGSLFEVAVMVVVLELTFKQIAQRLCLDPRTAQRWGVASLSALAAI